MKLPTYATLGAAFLIAACGPLEPIGPEPGTDCGAVRPWDGDGDGISDRVESNNGSNGYADIVNGRCDADPSRAIGSPGNGTLVGGLNLPDRNTGYAHFYGTDAVDTDDWGTLELLTCVEAAGRTLSGTGVLLQVGDLSLRDGGLFPPHQGHQNGLEGDFRYVRADRAQIPLDLSTDPDAYDPEATRLVFEALFDECNIDFILVDKDRLDFTLADRDTRILDSQGHANHFHIRIRGD